MRAVKLPNSIAPDSKVQALEPNGSDSGGQEWQKKSIWNIWLFGYSNLLAQ